MLPLSVIRFRLELIPCLAGWTKQKLPTTSTTQNSLSPVAASMIFSVGGTTMRVVNFILARIGMMSWLWYWTVRADSVAGAAGAAGDVSGDLLGLVAAKHETLRARTAIAAGMRCIRSP